MLECALTSTACFNLQVTSVPADNLISVLSQALLHSTRSQSPIRVTRSCEAQTMSMEVEVFL
jgi:hypothetical protein